MCGRLFLCGLALCWLIPRLRADHFTIDLEVTAGKSSKKAFADTLAIGSKPKPRKRFEIRSDEKLVVKWSVTSAARKETVKDVIVHFFAVKIDKVGQQTVPKLDRDVAAESALTMDFNPKDKARGEMSLAIEKAGVYLFRLETIGGAVGADGHEHFAALDVVVK
jgi:hypothetical protein